MSLDNKQILRNPDIIMREDLDDNAILFDPSSDKAFTLNTIGIFVWKALNTGQTLDELVDKVRQSYPDAPEHVENDIRSFLSVLIERGLAGYIL